MNFNNWVWAVWGLLMSLIAIFAAVTDDLGFKDMAVGYAIVAGLVFYFDYILELNLENKFNKLYKND